MKQPKSIEDLFQRCGELTELPEEEFRKRIEEHTRKENLRETMDFVFPMLAKKRPH